MSSWNTESLSKLNLTTHCGQSLTFEFVEDCEKNRPNYSDSLWSVHSVNAFLTIDGKKTQVGYLKVSYIPQSSWDEKILASRYPEVLVYAAKVSGWCIPVDEDDEAETLHRTANYCNMDLYNEKAFLNNPHSSKAYQDAKKDLYDRVDAKVTHKMKDCKDFHIDKPLVDFISVDSEYQRKGIGNALYFATVTLIADNGLTLHASGIQTLEGKANFQRFKANYPEMVRKSGDRWMVSPEFAFFPDVELA